MEITDLMKKQLALFIQEEVKKEFSFLHFSGNLMNTITINKTKNGWEVDIPAEMFSISDYKKKGVIIKIPGGGSYASLINTTGGFSGKHKGYVEECISKAINKWMYQYQIKGKVK